MGIRRSAAAEKPRSGIRTNLVPRTRRNENRIPLPHLTLNPVNFHHPTPVQKKIKLLAFSVEVPFRPSPCGQGGLGQALVLHRGIGIVQKAADLRAIFGREWFLAG